MKQSKKKLPISAVMVIHNEEKKLEKSLKSFSDLVSEIIIVHDGKCGDESLEIAKKYTNKVFVKPFVGEAEPHRPFTYKAAKFNWILQIDADEFLSKDLQKKLPQLIKKNVDIYDISWVRIQQRKYYSGLYKRALFKKNKIFFIGAPHEHSKPINKQVKIIKINCALLHNPKYISGFLTLKNKWLAWIRIQAKYYLKDFSKITKWNCKLEDWELKTKIRINHPILFGMFGHVAYLIGFNIINFIRKRDIFYLKELVSKPIYLYLLYFYIIKFRFEKT